MKTLGIIALVVSLIFALLWYYYKPGWDSGATILASLTGLIVFLHDGKKDSATVKIKPLSGEAKKILREIDSSNESGGKGITVFTMHRTRGFYVPFLWNDHLHGAMPFQNGDVTPIMAAINELIEGGYISSIGGTQSLKQYMRTTLRP